ncbi:hypothetical protein PV325_012458 [Microctonus aethiopoides]|nr:hypothetical protein PV325_012458 [Microctonus aethiopoides]
MTRNFKYWTKRGVIEVKPKPFIGNFGDCLIAKRSAGQWVQDIYNYGTGSPFARANPEDKLASASLFLMKNPTWKMVRSKLTTIYTPAKLKKMFELMMEVGDDLDKHMESFDLSGQENSRNFLRQITWDALAERERSGIIKDDLVGRLVELRKAYYENPDKGDFGK